MVRGCGDMYDNTVLTHLARQDRTGQDRKWGWTGGGRSALRVMVRDGACGKVMVCHSVDGGVSIASASAHRFWGCGLWCFCFLAQ